MGTQNDLVNFATTGLQEAVRWSTVGIVGGSDEPEAYHLARAVAEGAAGPPQQYLDAYIRPYLAGTLDNRTPARPLVASSNESVDRTGMAPGAIRTP
jgi:hypothetical protein